MTIELSDSEVMALADIVGAHLRTPNHTEVYIDAARGVETTPEGLLGLLLDARTAEASMPARLTHRLRYKAAGAHVHCRFFSPHGAKNGDLVFDEREWPGVRDALSNVLDVLPEDAP